MTFVYVQIALPSLRTRLTNGSRPERHDPCTEPKRPHALHPTPPNLKDPAPHDRTHSSSEESRAIELATTRSRHRECTRAPPVDCCGSGHDARCDELGVSGSQPFSARAAERSRRSSCPSRLRRSRCSSRCVACGLCPRPVWAWHLSLSCRSPATRRRSGRALRQLPRRQVRVLPERVSVGRLVLSGKARRAGGPPERSSPAILHVERA